MKSRMLVPALVAVGLFCMATASSASAFELLNRAIFGGTYMGSCGCDTAPACGCDNDCGRHRCHHHRNRCGCDNTCGCEATCAAPAKCGCEAVNTCGCDRAPRCCRQPRCSREKCCREPRCCRDRCHHHRNRCGCDNTCGCESTCAAPAPKCGCGA